MGNAPVVNRRKDVPNCDAVRIPNEGYVAKRHQLRVAGGRERGEAPASDRVSRERRPWSVLLVPKSLAGIQKAILFNRNMFMLAELEAGKQGIRDDEAVARRVVQDLHEGFPRVVLHVQLAHLADCSYCQVTRAVPDTRGHSQFCSRRLTPQ